ncbi:Rhodanese-like domain-containing protein isoform 2 [Cladophialophora immunda]|nr:Rhodanese-like domain-containing protein isoform 2 [Cladophialophora immunda]
MAQIPTWYEAYPKPRNQSPTAVSRQELLQWLQGGKVPGVDFLLIDLRRTDHEVKRNGHADEGQWLTGNVQGGTIKGSINLPAQSLYHSLPTLLNLCQSAGIRTVIWYCGSSKGRGTRASGWFQDLLDDQQVSGMTNAILLDGLAGWARAGDEYTRLMEEYDPEKWLNEK